MSEDESANIEIEGVVESIGDWEPADPANQDTLCVNVNDLLTLLHESVGSLLAMRKAMITNQASRIAELEAESEISDALLADAQAENQQLREGKWLPPETLPLEFGRSVILKIKGRNPLVATYEKPKPPFLKEPGWSSQAFSPRGARLEDSRDIEGWLPIPEGQSDAD